ncbi:MarR family transcriptional regulator [Pseudomonas oryzihabitans]|uniref:MarR family winged helix-turn-helix transcriptional regulator n=1 Tax=Pseudomonas oryzihabitans TaxID=47885 RepID=UPI0005CA30B1|nr:MarR family transcriptional regulator [Pseudomonas oryzihabitans]KIZ51765.1 MarR family transcriptional regulator [Pseudomonas oryzihabitans]
MSSPDDATPQDPAATPWLDTAVGYALRRAQMKMFQHLVDSLAAYDLRPAQFTALVILEQEPGLMQADLARRLAIEPPQLVLLLNKLERQGLAERVRGTQDRRAYALHLTEQGRALVGELKERAAASDRAASAPLDDAERAELLRLLRKLNGELG